MKGKLELKGTCPYTTVEVKKIGGHSIKDKYSNIMKNVIPIHQVKSNFDETSEPGNRKENGR